MLLSEVSDKNDFLDGVLVLIDKPMEWSSFDAVKKVKSILRKNLEFKKIKVGHGGTLDPLATGLLIIGTGKATKLLHQLQNEDKEYVSDVFLGATTPSFDLESEVDKTFKTDHINKDLVLEKLNEFIGEFEQTPPIFSAKKIDGKRAYEYARNGEEIKMKSNLVHFHEMELLEYSLPNIAIRIKCSKGTYIRSLANDIGLKLNSGGYMAGLIRTKSGGYSLKDAVTIEKFEEIIKELSKEQ